MKQFKKTERIFPFINTPESVLKIAKNKVLEFCQDCANDVYGVLDPIDFHLKHFECVLDSSYVFAFSCDYGAKDALYLCQYLIKSEELVIEINLGDNEEVEQEKASYNLSLNKSDAEELHDLLYGVGDGGCVSDRIGKLIDKWQDKLREIIYTTE